MLLDTWVPDDDYRPNAYEPQGVMQNVLQVASGLTPGALVVLHGWPGNGKTPSARWLGRHLMAPVLVLDNCRRVGVGGSIVGFDEDAMANAIAERNKSGKTTIVVDGVCACRVCSPDVLLMFGEWPGRKLTSQLTNFIGDYDPFAFRGRVATFHASFRQSAME